MQWPTNGVLQVWTTTKMLNAVWMAARSQPCVFWISGTNCVQEYWMFDAATMQATPNASWPQRDASTWSAAAGELTVDDIAAYPIASQAGCRRARCSSSSFAHA